MNNDLRQEFIINATERVVASFVGKQNMADKLVPKFIEEIYAAFDKTLPKADANT